MIEFCEKELGLTRDQAWKRSQAAGVVTKEPVFLDMLKRGETSVSTLAVIAPKLTEKTADQFKDFIPHKSRREAEAFASILNRDGSREAKPATVKVPLDLQPKTLEKLNRVRKLLRQNKAEFTDDQLVDELLETVLDRRDPARKAERAEKRKVVKIAKEAKSVRKLSLIHI